MKVYRDITEEQWSNVMPLLPELRPRAESRGRPMKDTRKVLNGALWVMFSGASWSRLPNEYPSYQTCHRRFKNWHQTGVLKRMVVCLFGAAEGKAFYQVALSRMRQSSLAANGAATADAKLVRRAKQVKTAKQAPLGRQSKRAKADKPVNVAKTMQAGKSVDAAKAVKSLQAAKMPKPLKTGSASRGGDVAAMPIKSRNGTTATAAKVEQAAVRKGRNTPPATTRSTRPTARAA
ncbi:MAG: transposase [Janthinobacterium lividum]